MDKTQKEELKVRIEKRIVRLRKDIAELKELTRPISPDDAIGRVSRMDAINNKSVNEAGLRQRKSQLNNLEFALKNINDAGFGNCISCGQEIPYQRLFVMPESNKCVRCASK